MINLKAEWGFFFNSLEYFVLIFLGCVTGRIQKSKYVDYWKNAEDSKVEGDADDHLRNLKWCVLLDLIDFSFSELNIFMLFVDWVFWQKRVFGTQRNTNVVVKAKSEKKSTPKSQIETARKQSKSTQKTHIESVKPTRAAVILYIPEHMVNPESNDVTCNHEPKFLSTAWVSIVVEVFKHAYVRLVNLRHLCLLLCLVLDEFEPNFCGTMRPKYTKRTI